MKIGNININDCKLGNTQIQKVMLGNNLIWEKNINFLTNLVAYYPFEGNAIDMVNSYNGSLVGSPTFTTGKNNLGINFGNGSVTRYVEIPDKNDFSFTNGTTDVPFSISLWANFSSFSSVGNWLVNKRNATNGGDEWQIVYYQNILYFQKLQFNNNTIYQGVGTGLNPFVLNTWYHICYTDNGSGLISGCKLYINGVLSNSIQNSAGVYTRMNNGTAKIRIGQAGWVLNTNLKHKGLVDELAIWKNRELTPTEVLELYNSSLGKFYPF